MIMILHTFNSLQQKAKAIKQMDSARLTGYDFARVSNFQIEPWKEQSNNIPQQIMTNAHLHTNHPYRKIHSKSYKNLQTQTNSVYFIKDHSNQHSLTQNRRNIIHLTPQHFAKMRVKSNNKQVKIWQEVGVSEIEEEKVREDEQRNNKFLRTELLHSKKQIIFNLNKMKENLIAEEKFQLNRNINQVQQVKKDLRYNHANEIQEIINKRKLKTDQSMFKNHQELIVYNKSEINPESKFDRKQHKSSQWKNNKIKPLQNQKLSIKLALERKLYLMKSDTFYLSKKMRDLESRNQLRR